MRLIWNGAPLDEFAPAGHERGRRVRRELGLAEDALVVGTIGRLNAQKGHRFLLDAAAALCRTPSRCRASWSWATATSRTSCGRRRDRLQIAERVVFAGHRTDVPDLLAALDVFCISSLYEGTPLALFEAMAAGRAIVSTAVDGCREVLEDGRNALLVPPGDAEALAAGLERVAGDPALRESLARQALADSSRYDVAACVEQMEALYDEVLAEGREPVSLARSLARGLGGPAGPPARPLPPLRHRRRRSRPGTSRCSSSTAPSRAPWSASSATSTTTATRRSPPTSTSSVIRGEQAPPDRAVLLTFDDGRGSLWSVAAPLLERFGMKAVVFLVPGRMRSRPGPLPPTWADVEAGRADADEVLDREDGEGALLSWEEVESLAKRGVFDFQSHTLTHARVHSGGRLAGFATPWSRRGYDAFDQPLVRGGRPRPPGRGGAAGDAAVRVRAPHLRDPALLRGPGGPAGLRGAPSRPRARASSAGPTGSRLLQGGSCPGHPVRGRLETRDEQVAAIERELEESRRLIEGHAGPAGRPPLLPVARLRPHRHHASPPPPATRRSSAARCRESPSPDRGATFADRPPGRGLPRAAARAAVAPPSRRVLRRQVEAPLRRRRALGSA